MTAAPRLIRTASDTANSVSVLFTENSDCTKQPCPLNGKDEDGLVTTVAAAQKNTVELPRSISRGRIGFDFAIAEECGRWNECQGYRDVYGNHVIVIEYRLQDFRKTCKAFGSRLTVVLRDVNVTRPGSKTYRYAAC